MTTKHDRPSRSAIALAVQTIANSHDLKKQQQGIIALTTVDHGGFVGDLAPLNVLVEYARDHGPESLEPLFDLAERKHREVFPGQNNDVREEKNRYQASYMAQRRARVRRATTLYEKLHERKLSPDEKREFGRSIHSTWMLWRNELLEGKQLGDERNEIVRLFWEDIDDQIGLGLQDDLVTARRVLAEE